MKHVFFLMKHVTGAQPAQWLEVFAKEMEAGWIRDTSYKTSGEHQYVLAKRILGPNFMVGSEDSEETFGKHQKVLFVKRHGLKEQRSQHLESDEKPDTTTFRLLSHIVICQKCTIIFVLTSLYHQFSKLFFLLSPRMFQIYVSHPVQ